MLENRVIGLQSVPWRQLRWFQSKEFKNFKATDMMRLKASIVANGFAAPFKAWRDEDGVEWILDGHHLQLALEQLTREGVEIPDMMSAIFVRCKDKQEAAKLVVLYSAVYAKIAREGLVDFAAEFDLAMSDLNLEFDLPGLNLEALANSSMAGEVNQEEVVPAPDERVITHPGDLWRLGRHLLLCGDSKSKEDCEKLMRDHKAEMVFTDPPYNVPMNFISVRQKVGDGIWDEFAEGSGEMSSEEFVSFLKTIFERLIEHSCEGSIHYICMDWRHIPEMLQAGSLYTEFKQLVVWAKNVGGMGTFYRSQHELVFIFKNGDVPHINNFELGQNGRYRTNVWQYDSAVTFSKRQNATEGDVNMHPTVKPIQMVVDAILDCSRQKGVILDLFGGSGTTLIAAEVTNRQARIMEISPAYCDVIVKRYVRYCRENGKTPSVSRNNSECSITNLESLWAIPLHQISYTPTEA